MFPLLHLAAHLTLFYEGGLHPLQSEQQLTQLGKKSRMWIFQIHSWLQECCCWDSISLLFENGNNFNYWTNHALFPSLREWNTKKDYVRHIIYTDKYLVWDRNMAFFHESNQKSHTSDSGQRAQNPGTCLCWKAHRVKKLASTSNLTPAKIQRAGLCVAKKQSNLV